MFCGPPANEIFLNLTIHTAFLTNLLPNAKYKYFLVGDNRAYTFTSALVPGDNSTFEFIATGDNSIATDPRRR